MTVVAVVSSTEEVLDNTAAQNQNWNWIIKDPPLPFGASGVGLNFSMIFFNISQSFNLLPLPKVESHLASYYISGCTSIH